MDVIRHIIMFNFGSYSITAHLFPKLLGLIYFISFGSFILQIKGLIGTNGILPAKEHLAILKERFQKSRFYYVPSIFWFGSSDVFLSFFMYLGAFTGFFLFINPFTSINFILLLILLVLQLSLVHVGQDFLGFGWELYLIEITFATLFLSLLSPPNPFIFYSLYLTLFNEHILAGSSKLISNDKNWRNLTAIAYHYQSQPIANTLAWYMHKLPLGFHKFSCLYLFFVELIVPFGMFFGEDIRLYTFFLLASLQLFIYLTGNFSYLNHLTFAFSTLLISDKYLSPFFSMPPVRENLFADIVTTLVAIILIILQIANTWNFFFRSKPILKKALNFIRPFHLISSHGIFAVMTTKRYEIIIEASIDRVEWKEYDFYFKPVDIYRRPTRISPYQPRLDWMMWFLPFSSFHFNPWFLRFLEQLLKSSPQVMQLIRSDPFNGQKPKWIRALIYEYQFSDLETKKLTKAWWQRSFIGAYTPDFSLEEKKK